MYLALARKYRPQTFEDLIGQPHITKTLQNAIAMDKLYPALIFSGMKGVGKTSAARILSKTLNCENGPAIEPCNHCSACTEITEDKSPDYIEIDGASNNGVEEVRTLKEKVKYKPFKNRFRVVVIDEVHMLSNSAWNALLKTIEEPPEHTYFIMATTDFHKIPATIVSRCQHFEFKRIPQEVIIKLLKEICTKENITIPEYSLYLIAKASEGGLRDAKKILDQAIALSNGNVSDKDVVAILGVIEEEIFIDLTRNIITKNRTKIIEKIHDLAERGMDLRFFYNEYLKFFRDLIVLKSLEESEGLHNLNPENIPLLKDMLKDVGEVELLRYFNAAKDLEVTIRSTENPRIILEYLFLKLSFFPSLISIEEFIEKTKATYRPGAANGSSATGVNNVNNVNSVNHNLNHHINHHVNHHVNVATREEPVPSEAVVGDPSVEGSHPHLLAKIIDAIRKEDPRLAASLNEAQASLVDHVLTLTFPATMELAYKNAENNLQRLQDLASRLEGRKIEIRFLLDKTRTISEDEARQEELRNDPKLLGLADRLKGRIVSVKKT
ncbi:MAG: DNA polymerase III subunit gamma/tau [Candidatus Omnitrophota bacterium]